MFQYSLCAFLAPALVSAAAFPWAGPEPTLIIPEQDRWSPAPTAAPGLGGLELFRRAEGDNTCGYISGESTRSLTCNNDNFVCATNSYYGVHGCCDPNGIETCTMPTACVPSSALTSSVSAASDNGLVASCTDSAAPYCYQWLYVYASTVMTEFGCAESAFTISVERTMSDASTDIEDSNVSELTSSSSSSSSSSSPATTDASTTATSGASSATSSAATATGGASDEVKKKALNVGAIAGGVVGGVLGIGAIAFGIVFFVLRSRRNKQNAANAASGASQPFIPGQGPAPGVTEYKPQAGYPSPQPYGMAAAPGYYNQGHEQKQQWPQQGVPGQEYGQPMYSPPGSPNPPYPGPVPMGPGAVPQGIAEAGGSEIQQQPGPASAKQHPGPQGPPGQPGQPGQPGGPVYEAP